MSAQKSYQGWILRQEIEPPCKNGENHCLRPTLAILFYWLYFLGEVKLSCRKITFQFNFFQNFCFNLQDEPDSWTLKFEMSILTLKWNEPGRPYRVSCMISCMVSSIQEDHERYIPIIGYELPIPNWVNKIVKCGFSSCQMPACCVSVSAK